MLSLIMVTYNMRREAARTLYSLAVPYQRGVSPEDYEVLVVDNGSTQPLDEAWVRSFGPGFRYFYRQSDHPSPAAAMNFGVRHARHDNLGLFVDGARMASPGLLLFAMRGLAFHRRAFVAALSWHLGPDVQWRSVTQGYSREMEDELLQRSGWMQDGYQLFAVSTLAGANRDGYFVTPSESTALFLPRALHDELGGFDERFVSVGGGLVNGDFFRRACEAQDAELVILLGEGTFHQFHGDTSRDNSQAVHEERRQIYLREYEMIRNRPHRAPRKSAIYLGTVPRQGIDILLYSANQASRRDKGNP